MKAGALGLGMAAIPGLSACTSGTPGESGSSGSVPTVELGSEVTSGGPTFPEGYLGPRITERKPFGDGSKTFRVVVPQDSTIVGDWNANKMTAWFEKFTGVKVQFDAVLMTAPDGTTDMTKINAMLAGGDLPDAFLGIPFTTAQLSLYGQQGLFVSMDDFMPLAPTLRQAMTDYPDLKKVVAATDGKMYTFPGINDCFHCRSSPGRAWISQSYLDKVGMPVPGTGTAVWWETLQNPRLILGMPEVGFRDEKGQFMEKTQVEPDVKVRNDAKNIGEGRDQQLEKAVEILLQD